MPGTLRFCADTARAQSAPSHWRSVICVESRYRARLICLRDDHQPLFCTDAPTFSFPLLLFSFAWVFCYSHSGCIGANSWLAVVLMLVFFLNSVIVRRVRPWNSTTVCLTQPPDWNCGDKSASEMKCRIGRVAKIYLYAVVCCVVSVCSLNSDNAFS